ncbi:MAG: DAK2 domain-containing protein [Lachnospiraceae bacterium]|nr:DAK2 domain-containing protein [Lachnospiraceae bacterium]
MAHNTINAALLSQMFIAGAKKLEVSKEWINELNVFPVPDGDTGTNMTLTIMSAAGEVVALKDPDMASVCKAISSGSLRGARGNSGVILSQLFRGFTNVVRDYDEITVNVLADAMEKAVETAYKAVMKPKEGTILTVARGASEKGRALINEGVKDMAKFLDEVIKHADEVLLKTPDLLPVLKQAGVVDSGGQGLMEVLKGAFDIFMGKELDLTISAKPTMKPKTDAKAEIDIKFGYCTEFIIMLTRHFNIKQELDYKSYLESIGDSIVVVADDDLIKVHVHTNDPGLALQKALKYGALSNIKIDNMRLEHQETLFNEGKDAGKDMPRKEVGFIAVSVGAGINEIFTGLGVDYLIEGGQTMNPSTEDMLNAISHVNADNIYILPNNKNIILAANQAATLVNDKKIIVIPTKTVPQGITAIINFVPDLGIDENTANMSEELKGVKTGQVTYAVRDTMIDDKEIKQGDYMGINDDGICSVGTHINDVTFEMITQMADDSNELISIYYGEDIEEQTALAMKERIKDKYSRHDIELQYGGQPIYYYIISVE